MSTAADPPFPQTIMRASRSPTMRFVLLSLLRSLKHPTRALSPSRHLTVTETHNETHKHTTRALSPSRSVFLSRTPHPLALWLVLGLELAGCGVKAKEESGDEETRRREGGCWWRVLVGATGSSLATGSSHGMWRVLVGSTCSYRFAHGIRPHVARRAAGDRQVA